MSIEHLQTLYPYIQWIEYIKNILPDQLNVTQDEIVVNTVPSFFEALTSLLETTPKRTMSNYLIWRTIEFGIVYSTKELRDIQQEYVRAETGQMEMEPRWRECIDVVSSK